MTTSPFVTTEIHGRFEHTYFNKEQFGRALAAALGAESIVDGAGGKYPNVSIDCGDGVFLYIRDLSGNKCGSVEICAYVKDSNRVGSQTGNQVPRATVNSARDMTAIAKDVLRRVIDPARAYAAEINSRLEAKDAKIAELQGRMRAITAQFPLIAVAQRNPDDLSATLYFNSFGNYMTGTLYPDGHCSFERVSMSSEASALALFALMSGNAG